MMKNKRLLQRNRDSTQRQRHINLSPYEKREPRLLFICSSLQLYQSQLLPSYPPLAGSIIGTAGSTFCLDAPWVFSSLGSGSDCITSPFDVARGGLGEPEVTNMHSSEVQVSQVILVMTIGPVGV